jgi:ABC-type dipeptide/oligopeptide/nickel transport system permease component
LIFSFFGFYYLCENDCEEDFEVREGHIKTYLKEVTRKRYNGHIAGSEDNKRLARYIEQTLRQLGYNQGNREIRVHTFEMMGLEPDLQPIVALGTEAEQETYSNLEDYRMVRNAHSGNIDYKGPILLNKGSLANLNPEEVVGKVILTNIYANQKQTIEIARDMGIRGIIYATKNLYVNIQDRFIGMGEKKSDDLFMMNIDAALMPALEKIAIENEGVIPYGHLSLQDQYPLVQGQNIIAMIQGRNPNKEMYFVTHYDGKGSLGDSFYPGASRNGTAMAVMLELANVLSKAEYQPDYSIGFVFLDGKELGNLGAEAFFEQCVDSNKSQEFIVLNDIGISNQPDLYLNNSSTTIIPTEESRMLYNKLAMFAGDAGISTKQFGISFSSDGIFAGETAESFANHKLPVVELKSYDTLRGVPYVYTPEDTWDKVEIDKVMDVAVLLSHYIYYEGYNGFDTAYLQGIEQFLIYTILFLLLLVSCVSTLYRWKPNLEIDVTSVRDIYFSVSFGLVKKLVSIVVPTLLMLWIMVAILSIPGFTSRSDYGIGYDSYVPYLHIKQTILYIRMLIFGGLDALSPTAVGGILRGGVNSFRLLSLSLGFSLLLGIGLGMWNGLRRNAIRTFLGIFVFSIPDVLISLGGLYSIVYFFKDSLISPETLRVSVMPTLAMIVVPSIYISRMIEVAVVEEREASYIYGALARGVGKTIIVWQHIFPKVLSKLFDGMGSVIRIAIVNLIVVEYIFSTVGIGNYLMANYHNAFYVIYISFAFGLMYFILTQFFLGMSWRINPMKRRLSS